MSAAITLQPSILGSQGSQKWGLLGFVWVDRALRHGCMALKSGRAAASRRVLGFCGHDPDSCDRFGASESAPQPMPGFVVPQSGQR